MEILPLAYTQGDLKTLVKICQNVFGESPTRGLDKSYLKNTDPAAFLACLDMSNQPMKALRDESEIWKHFNLSFIAVVDADILIELQNKTSLNIFSRQGRKNYVAVLTGSILAWKNFCLENGTPEFMKLVQEVTSYLKQTGLREIFNSV